MLSHEIMIEFIGEGGEMIHRETVVAFDDDDLQYCIQALIPSIEEEYGETIMGTTQKPEEPININKFSVWIN